jgi:EAL domain-containing protein (putative c-di-GMP-specific phosphodiesterase class I)
MGCDTAQGYLFAKPMPRDTFVQLLGAQPLSFERLHVAASKRAAKG